MNNKNRHNQPRQLKLTVNGTVVKINFPPTPDPNVIKDIKRMILDGLKKAE